VVKERVKVCEAKSKESECFDITAGDPFEFISVLEVLNKKSEIVVDALYNLRCYRSKLEKELEISCFAFDDL